MPTPTQGYRLADGTKVDGVTSVMGRFKESGGLIHWAWKLGIEGKDYRAVRDASASSGTLAHDMIAAHLDGRPLPAADEAVPEETWHEASVAFAAFRDWQRGTRLVIHSAEKPLVSEAHGFGGTPDFWYEPRGLGDFKTTKRLYPEVVIQLGAYRLLWEENGLGKIDEGHVLRFDKENGQWEEKHVSREDLILGGEVFLTMLRLYRDLKTLNRWAKQ